ncbi:MAG: hypothetical protein JWN34_4479 [Bryobacterales bacterium]|nr:hypothetical protein [Bryobacterales bacterium]
MEITRELETARGFFTPERVTSGRHYVALVCSRECDRETIED